MAPVTQKGLWAPVHRTAAGKEWINWKYLQPTKRECKKALLSDILAPRNVLASTRFAMVVVTEVEIAAREGCK